MDNIFGSNLRRIRKEKGITQEQLADAVGVSPQAVSKWEISSYPDTQLLPAVADFLGITIDEFFGRGQEEISIYDRVLRHLKNRPYEEMLQEAFKICYALPQACCGADAYIPISEGILKGVGWDNHSEIVFPKGIAQSRNNGNLQYFLIMPEPEGGYDDILAYDEEMVKLFEVLSVPNALRTLYFLAGCSAYMFFKMDTLVHELGITPENAGQIIEGLCSCRLIWETTLNNGEEKEKIYQYNGHCNLISFLNFTRTLLYRPSSFTFQTNNRGGEAFFMNDTYKKSKTVNKEVVKKDEKGKDKGRV